MINKHISAATAALAISVVALAGTPCGKAHPPVWDSNEGTCQGGILASCQDTNLLADGYCQGVDEPLVCNAPDRYKLKKTYVPGNPGRCNQSSNPCILQNDPNPPHINYKDAKQGPEACGPTPVDPPGAG